MKILHTVEFYPPSVGGMQEVVRQLSERLVKLGHDVTIATTRIPARTENIINGVKIVEFNISGNFVRGLTGNVREYEDFLLNSDFDVITNFAAQQWATDVMLPLLGKIKTVKVFVPTGFSGLYMPQYKDYFAQMKSWMRQYDMNVFLSDNYRDINFARGHGVKKTTLISNGAAADEFLSENPLDIRKRLGIPDTHFLILHVGSHTGVKGHRESIEIFSKADIENATFLLVGNDFRGCTRSCVRRERKMNKTGAYKDKAKRLIVASLSREETVAAYKSADLFLFTSNIECSPIVLFECMASETPFLTTDVGNSAEIVQWSGAGILLPTKKAAYLRKGLRIFLREALVSMGIVKRPSLQATSFLIARIEESVSILEDIYRQPEKRRQMAEAGFKAWQERFTWEKIARDYGKLYDSLMRGEK